MESTCPECNTKIGGQGHKLLHGKVLGDVTGGDADALFQASVLVDNSDPGYCLRGSDKEDRFFSARKLTDKTLRLVRVLLHGALAVGHHLGREEWVAEMLTVVNPGCVPLTHSHTHCAERYYSVVHSCSLISFNHSAGGLFP